MTSGSRRLRGAVAALAVLALTTVTPAAANAGEEPVGDRLGSIADGAREQVRGITDSAGVAGGPSRVTGEVPPVTSDDDSAGHETEDPQAPDHGGATVLDTGVAGEDVARVGESRATVEDDDSTSGDATLLALGGEEIAGAHADSGGEEEAHFGDPLAPLCSGSEGQVCLSVLYADAWASEKGGTSSSRGRTGVADVCLGGDGSDGCTGPVSTGVATSESEAERDQKSGRSTASSSSEVADVCVQPDPVTGLCAVGVEVLHSEGRSDSGGGKASAERDSHLLALELGNEEQARVGDPQALSLPPDCPEGGSLVCLFVNQGETYLGNGSAGHAQEALHVDVLPGNLDLVVEAGRSETLVHNDGGEAGGDGSGPTVRGAGGGPGSPGTVAGVADMLPQTGGVWSGLLALALLGIGAGALLTARSRRGVAESA